MTSYVDILFDALAEGAREERKRVNPIGTRSGKVLSLIRSNGEWLAVVAAFTAPKNTPVLSKIVPIGALKGSARRKADRWVQELS